MICLNKNEVGLSMIHHVDKRPSHRATLKARAFRYIRSFKEEKQSGEDTWWHSGYFSFAFNDEPLIHYCLIIRMSLGGLPVRWISAISAFVRLRPTRTSEDVTLLKPKLPRLATF